MCASQQIQYWVWQKNKQSNHSTDGTFLQLCIVTNSYLLNCGIIQVYAENYSIFLNSLKKFTPLASYNFDICESILMVFGGMLFKQ